MTQKNTKQRVMLWIVVGIVLLSFVGVDMILSLQP